MGSILQVLVVKALVSMEEPGGERRGSALTIMVMVGVEEPSRQEGQLGLLMVLAPQDHSAKAALVLAALVPAPAGAGISGVEVGLLLVEAAARLTSATPLSPTHRVFKSETARSTFRSSPFLLLQPAWPVSTLPLPSLLMLAPAALLAPIPPIQDPSSALYVLLALIPPPRLAVIAL